MDSGESASRPLVVWRVIDGKPGHENQSQGLVEALGRRRPVTCIDVPAPRGAALAGLVLLHRLPSALRGAPRADLVLGAGHATHLPLLALARRARALSVVLMRPSLPLSWFDLVVAPEHDGVTGFNVLTTLGVLNRMRPGDKQADAGLFLIGGPSRHVVWDTARVLSQMREIVARDPARHWVVATSRRTPGDFIEQARQALADAQAIEFVPPAEAGPDWLPRTLARMPLAWVTADSVSMVYEALSAGARVGLLELEFRGGNRLLEGLRRLAAAGRVRHFSEWVAGRPLEAQPPLAEADRVAEHVLDLLPEAAA